MRATRSQAREAVVARPENLLAPREMLRFGQRSLPETSPSMSDGAALSTETVLRYPVYDGNGVLLLKGGSKLTPRLLDLLEQRQVSLAIYATLEVTQGAGEQTEIALKDQALTIGRAPECDLRPAHPLVSKKHCLMRKHAYSVMLRDLRSTNGTFVNGTRVTTAVELSDGDIITLGGGVSMTVHIFAAVRGSYGEDTKGLVLGNSPDDELSDRPTQLAGVADLQELLSKAPLKS